MTSHMSGAEVLSCLLLLLFRRAWRFGAVTETYCTSLDVPTPTWVWQHRRICPSQGYSGNCLAMNSNLVGGSLDGRCCCPGSSRTINEVGLANI
ncbi:hypothetical protein BKA83DRAFT_4372068 [Pisolithus microcarpus]|nr:hypothetical protein BKA83DRAFT_4372068 [Pisolithus microcarpus]